VNSVKISAYGTANVGTIFPFNTFDRSWPRLSFGTDEVMVGSEGWSFGISYKSESHALKLISPHEAVVGSLKGLGIEAALSEPGQIAKQILEHLRGLWGVSLLADVETLKLLNAMAGGIRRTRATNRSGREVSDTDDEVEQIFDRRSRATKVWNDLISRRNAEHTFRGGLDQFTQRNVLRLGIQTQCPYCHASNWHGIDAATYQLICERCLKHYPFPQADLRKDNKNWAYRVVGPFSVPDYARGSYGALLSLRCLSRLGISGGSLTFSTALAMRFDGIEREADFVAWHQPDHFDNVEEPQLILGEAKSLGDGDLLKDSDISKLRDLGAKLPGALLVVSILRADFTEAEKKRLRSLVKWGRRLNAAGEPLNRVLLLTANEIFARFGGLEARWKELGGRHAALADHHHVRTLATIADSTVSIYLGLPSFEQQRHEAWEKRKRRGGRAAPPGRIGQMVHAVKPK
jgi:hypothetical protein